MMLCHLKALFQCSLTMYPEYLGVCQGMAFAVFTAPASEKSNLLIILIVKINSNKLPSLKMLMEISV